MRSHIIDIVQRLNCRRIPYDGCSQASCTAPLTRCVYLRDVQMLLLCKQLQGMVTIGMSLFVTLEYLSS